jgi:hypothetical protein
LKDRDKQPVAANGRLDYRAPEITDLGSVVDLTEAGSGGGTYDGAGYSPTGHS